MWPTLIIAAIIALVALHLYWCRRCAAERERAEQSSRELSTLRLQSQQALAHEHAQQNALFNSMVEGVLLLDHQGKIRLANQALECLFRLSSDIRGQSIMEAFRLHELQELVNRALIDGQVLGHELELPVLENRCLQVNTATFLNHDGQHKGMILVFHDLTRLKQLENTRKEFVANVSHELRTPLSLIKGYVETLLDGARNDPAVAERFLKIIERNTQRLDLLIQDLLTISALESERLKLELQPVNLHSLAEKVLGDLSSKAENKNVSLVNELPELTANGDVNRLDQVLANLVDNAIKYGRAEGSVRVGGKKLDDGRLEIFVQDDGPGIPPEAIDRVFERFYRVEKARSRDQGGTGLGLAIVKHIVHAHGGEVWAKSEIGRGATFFFTLPENRV